MRARYSNGSVVFDRRRKTWNFLQWIDGKRRSKVIGTKQQFPTKASAWKGAESLKAGVQATCTLPTTPTMNTLVAQYRAEKMPARASTKRGYEAWIDNHIMPRWGNFPLSEVQARPVELWLQSLTLAPKSKLHIRGILSILWDYAMW